MALSVDPLLLRAQASVFPKIMLLDKNIEKKLTDNKLVLSIVHTDDEHKYAQKLKDMIDTEYKHMLGKLGLEPRLVSLSDFNTSTKAGAYYIFDASSTEIKKVISHAKNNKRICFGYNYQDLKANVLISLFVKEKMYIYLSKSALQEYKIKFTPIFYKIAKVLE